MSEFVDVVGYEQQHASDQGGNGHGALATNVLDFDGPASQNGTRETDDGGDGVIGGR